MKRTKRPLLPAGEQSCRKIGYAMILLYILTLVPLVIIGHYDYPSADDYTMALGTRLTYESTGSICAVGWKILSETARYYRTWIGYFTSCLFTTVNPAVFGEKWYALTPVITLTALHAGVIVFLHVLLERVLGIGRYVRRCITVLVLFLMVQQMPEGGLRAEAFYWYSGAGNYTLTFALVLFYLAAYLLGIFCKGRKGCRWLSAAAMLGFFAGGGNYLSALSAAILSVCGCWLRIREKRGRREESGKEAVRTGRTEFLPEILPAVCMLCGFALNCLAPGNRVRGADTQGFGALKSILLSFYYTLSYPLNQWMNWSVLLVLALAGLVFWLSFEAQDAEGNRENIRAATMPVSFDHPLTAAAFSFGLVSAAVTPALYAQGNISAGRIQSTFWLHFVLVLVLLEWYLVGTLHRVAGRRQSKTGSGCVKRTVVVLGGMLFVFAALTIKGNPYFYTFSSAVEDLRNGSAKAYGEENSARESVLKDAGQEDAVLIRYTARPELLFYQDLSEDPEDWVNQRLCQYYHKKSVQAVTQQE